MLEKIVEEEKESGCNAVIIDEKSGFRQHEHMSVCVSFALNGVQKGEFLLNFTKLSLQQLYKLGLKAYVETFCQHKLSLFHPPKWGISETASPIQKILFFEGVSVKCHICIKNLGGGGSWGYGVICQHLLQNENNAGSLLFIFSNFPPLPVCRKMQNTHVHLLLSRGATYTLRTYPNSSP